MPDSHNDSLSRYNAKRDFTKTAEPAGKLGKTKGFSYLIQKHDATRLHYDFRLELDGVLKSWAVTRGPSLNPADKRLAVEVEDHPVAYGTFEGTIPKGEYGGGTVMLWDRGTWEPVGDPHEGLRKGDLKFKLHGERLTGEWALVRMRDREADRGRHNWLLIKHRDEVATDDDAETWLESNATSIVSGRTMDAIAETPGKVWHSKTAGGKSKAKAGTERNALLPLGGGGPRSGGRGKSDRKGKSGEVAGPPPTLKFIPPELATLSDDIPETDAWVHEVKFDGYRTQALIENGEVRLLTRTGLDWTPKFQSIADQLTRLDVQSAILDGEIVALDPDGVSSFKSLQDALKQGHSDNLQYYVFDLLHLDGEDLTRRPLLERKQRLHDLLAGFDDGNRVIYSDHFTHDSGFTAKVCDLKLEGLISKRADAPYSGGRNRTWLKIKCHKRQELVIGGFTEPIHAARGIGALLLGYYEDETFIYAGKCGTGFNAETSIDLRRQLDKLTRKTMAFSKVPPEVRREATWVTPDLVAEVEFTEWTPDGRLRHPSFQGLRADKPAAEVARDRTGPKVPQTGPKSGQKAPSASPKGARKSPQNLPDVPISHPDRIIFPGTDITKLDLAEYYASVADRILPHIANRPLSMLRCPEGIESECFFQRHMAHKSDYIHDTGIPVKGRHENYLMISDIKGLVSLAQWGVIELHPWGCMADDPTHPDRLIFDLDPDPEVPWNQVVTAALEVRDRMSELGLDSFPKTTGGKGIHVCIPLKPDHEWPAIKAFARAVAESMAHDSPKTYIATMSKAKRKGLIFIDYLRNELTATAVSAWSVRARPGANVSMPLSWDELTPDLKPSQFNILTALDHPDPWSAYFKSPQTLKRAYLDALGIA